MSNILDGHETWAKDFDALKKRLDKPAIYHVFRNDPNYNMPEAKKTARKVLDTYNVLECQKLKYSVLEQQINRMFQKTYEEVNRILEECDFTFADGQLVKNCGSAKKIFEELEKQISGYPSVNAGIGGDGRSFWWTDNDISRMEKFHPQDGELIYSYNQKQGQANESARRAANTIAQGMAKGDVTYVVKLTGYTDI